MPVIPATLPVVSAYVVWGRIGEGGDLSSNELNLFIVKPDQLFQLHPFEFD